MIFVGVVWIVAALMWASAAGKSVGSNDAAGSVFATLIALAFATSGVLALTGVIHL